MDMSQIWPRLTTSTQTWLVDHNGEQLPDDILDEVLSATGGSATPGGGLTTPSRVRPS